MCLKGFTINTDYPLTMSSDKEKNTEEVEKGDEKAQMKDMNDCKHIICKHTAFKCLTLLDSQVTVITVISCRPR